MARKPRDYKAEYARRKAREAEKAKAEGRPFDLAKARGHGSRAKERVQRWARQAAAKFGADPKEINRLGAANGWDALDKAIEQQTQMEAFYVSGQQSKSRQLWVERDQTFPDWIYNYHPYGLYYPSATH